MEITKEVEEAVAVIKERVPPDDVYLFLYYLISGTEALLDELYSVDSRVFCDLILEEQIHKLCNIIYSINRDINFSASDQEDDL